MTDTAPSPLTGTGLTTMDNNARDYSREMDWMECRVNPVFVIHKFPVTDDNTAKTG